jgi:homoserine kinase type II
VNADEVHDLLDLSERLAAETMQLRDTLRWEFLRQQLEEVMNQDYDLGRVVRIEQILGGAINISFGVTMQTESGEHRYFVRKYNEGITAREVKFEHALVNHIVGKGFRLPAKVYENKHGGTFATREEMCDGQKITRFFAVYQCLIGEDKYDWFRNRLADVEFEEAARVLAQFHHYAGDFDPGDLAREQPPIMDFIPTLGRAFRGWAAQSKGTAFDEYYKAHSAAIFRTIELGEALAADDLEGAPMIPVHCDYHPGNLKWIDERAVALFDFDWSKIDYRVFDVGEAIAYFCSSWDGDDSGVLWLDKTAIFVRAYQEESARFSEPGPMNARELAVLPRMIANGNLFILNWDLSAYYEDPEPDVDKYLKYLKHNVMVLEFLEEHVAELAALARPAAATPSTT